MNQTDPNSQDSVNGDKQDPENLPPLPERITNLREELCELERQLGGNSVGSKAWQILKKFGMFCLSYWALTSFLAAIATATYVKFAYDIDYFESYRNASSVKKLSQFHEQMGDAMFQQLNWKEATANYQKAIEVNPSNVSAALGEVKSNVLLPAEGLHFYDPDVVDARLKILTSLYPDDPQVQTLLALRAYDTGSHELALTRLDDCLKGHPHFGTAMVIKGFIQHDMNRFDESIVTMNQALKVEPQNAYAHSNLAWSLLLLQQQELALKHSEIARGINPSMLIVMVNSEIRRLSGDPGSAEAYLNNLLTMTTRPGIDKEPIWGGLWVWNHLPLAEGDRETIKQRTYCRRLEEKKSVLEILLGVVAGQMGEAEKARAFFTSAMQANPSQLDFLLNKLKATPHFIELTPSVETWMKEEAAFWENQPANE
jgi:tetratricopeptide (TPR) repeat protein